MFSRFGQLQIWCDAPPYAVVRACKGCGFHSPLDVRWCRMSRFLDEEGKRWRIFGFRYGSGSSVGANPRNTPAPAASLYPASRNTGSPSFPKKGASISWASVAAVGRFSGMLPYRFLHG